jgi:hypothetical protein
MHLTVDHGNVGKAFEEFEELRSLHDGVGDCTCFDQFLLSNLRAEVTAFGQSVGSHDRYAT